MVLLILPVMRTFQIVLQNGKVRKIEALGFSLGSSGVVFMTVQGDIIRIGRRDILRIEEQTAPSSVPKESKKKTRAGKTITLPVASWKATPVPSFVA